VDATDLAFAGIASQAELIRDGEVSSRELVELYLERIARVDPQINCFRVVLPERALEEARQADARRTHSGAGSGDERPLLGVPIALKDNLDLAGEVTANGSSAHGGPAAADAEMTKRLRAAGAVVIGKTHLPELAIMGATESATFGYSRNPWDPLHTTGGSSGGSAAAVAAGLVGAASASDGAGSIRIPASCCGVFGLKPQRGRVSLMPHRQHWQGMSVQGSVSRTVLDSALLLDVVSGAAAGDEDVAPPPSRPFVEAAQEPPGKLRIAYSPVPTIPTPVSKPVRGALEATAGLLRSLGHEAVETKPPYGDIGSNFIPRYLRGIADEVSITPNAERLERRTKGFAHMAAPITDGLIARVRADDQRHRERLGALFAEYDVLMTPVSAQPPVEVGRWTGLGALRTILGMVRVYPYTATWNATGQPAASVPAGFTDDGLPLSVQLIGRENDEATLLALAAQIESERPWAGCRPAIASEREAQADTASA
jgi:amidase